MLDVLYKVRYGAGWIILAIAALAIVYWGFVYQGRAPLLRVGMTEGRMYEEAFAESLKQAVTQETDHRVQVRTAANPADARRLIQEGKLDLGVFDAGSQHLRNLVAVMPLWNRQLQVLVSSDEDIGSVRELRGRQVWVGTSKSATREHARRLLGFHGIGVDAIDPVESSGLPEPAKGSGDDAVSGEVDAAIVARNPHAPALRRFMRSGLYDVLGATSMEGFVYNHQGYARSEVPAGAYPTSEGPLPEARRGTAASLAVLASRSGLAGGSVQALLEAATSARLQQQLTYVGNDQASLDNTAWSQVTQHTRAQGVFGSESSRLLEGSWRRAVWEHLGWWIALVVVVIAALVHWRRHYMERRRRERASARREVERQFEVLVEIERAVREARDAGALHEKLRELNETKAKVVKIALGSELVESGLFVAFLEQARSVSAEIEWRMSLGNKDKGSSNSGMARVK